MKILITGGAGFIGSHLCEKLIELGHSIICYDNFSNGNLNNIRNLLCNKNFKLVEGDIRNKNLLEKTTNDIDYLFHLAGQIHVEHSLIRPMNTVENNIIGTINILELCREKKFGLTFASSAEVYGSCYEGGEHKETNHNIPMSPYASSKVSAEALCISYFHSYGLNIKIIRNFNTYGPRQKFVGYGAVIPIFVQRAINNKNLVIYGDGEQTRDFQYIDDAVDGYILSINIPAGTIFNTGSGKDISINKLAELIIQNSDSNSKIIKEKERQGEVRKLKANIELFKKLGGNPNVKMDDGIKKTIYWFKNDFDQTLGFMQ